MTVLGNLCANFSIVFATVMPVAKLPRFEEYLYIFTRIGYIPINWNRLGFFSKPYVTIQWVVRISGLGCFLNIGYHFIVRAQLLVLSYLPSQLFVIGISKYLQIIDVFLSTIRCYLCENEGITYHTSPLVLIGCPRLFFTAI